MSTIYICILCWTLVLIRVCTPVLVSKFQIIPTKDTVWYHIMSFTGMVWSFETNSAQVHIMYLILFEHLLKLAYFKNTVRPGFVQTFRITVICNFSTNPIFLSIGACKFPFRAVHHWEVDHLLVCGTVDNSKGVIFSEFYRRKGICK